MRISRKLLIQVTLFLIVGVTTLLIDIAVTTTLYSLFYVPAYLASGIGFLSGFFFNFPMNRKKVFKHTKLDRFGIKSQVVFYISLSVFNLLATSALVELMVLGGIDIAVAKILVTVLIAIWNFLIFKFFIFSKKREVSN